MSPASDPGALARRTPLIAGNWKMHKTVAEAEEFIAALLPRVSSADGVDVAICPPFTALGAMVDSTRGSRVAVYAQNMHQADHGAFTGEVSAPMLTELDVQGVVLGHSERREYFGETDKALAQKVPAALAAGLLPVLCVGETEEERENGDTERKLRHQVQEDLARVETERLGEVVIAYEPIWAIGTGQVATPEQAQEAIAFVRALVGDRSASRPHGPGSSTAGASSPTTPPSCWRCPTSTARWSAAPAWTPSRSRRSSPRQARRRGLPVADGPSELPVERAVLIVLDGWGLAEPGPGNAVSLADTPVFDELWSRFPDDHADRVRPRRRPARGPDGQLRGRPSEPRRRQRRDAGPDADRRRRRERRVRRERGAARRLHGGGARPPDRAGVRRRRALEHGAPAGADRAGGVAGGPRPRRPRLHRRPRHAAQVGRRLPGARSTAWMAESGAGRIGSVVGRYYAMDRDKRWDRVKLAYDMLVHGRADHHVDSAAEAARAAYERDETDEFITPTLVGEEARIRPGDSVLGLNFRPDRMREITRALAEPGFDEFDREGGEPVERYTTMTEYEEGWPYPVAFPPERPETTIAAVIAARGERQLHVAETEKYPHVTYFFNGGEERPYEGEERELVPSPRDVPTYDHKPRDERAPRRPRRS